MSDEIIGIKVIPLRQIVDERGKVMHMLRADAPHFVQFGEVYFSVVDPKVIKGWHGYYTKWMNYACIVGKVKLVLYDTRPNSETCGQFQEIVLSPTGAYNLVIIPPGIMNGFMGLDDRPSMVAICASEPFDENKTIRKSLPEIPYDWRIRNG